MMKTSRKLLLGVGAIVVLGVIIGSTLARAHTAQASAASDCGSRGVLHHITIQNDRVSPEFTDGNVCDTIEFTNLDAVSREIGFGSHYKHVAYNGVTEKILRQHQSFHLVLNHTGQFEFHDHAHDEVMGYFNVWK